MPSSQAQKLVALIVRAVDDIEADTGSQIPGAVTADLNSPIIAPEDDLEATPKRGKALRVLQAATHQLLATLLPAGLQIVQTHFSALQTAALDVVVKAKIADIIHAVDPGSSKGGVHINLLSEKAEMESTQLSQILRFLAIRNIFCELTENHWANNRLSFPLRSDSKNSLINLLGHIRDDIALPALAELPKTVMKRKDDVLPSEDDSQTAWASYHKWKGNFFDFLGNSEGGWQAERFGKAMIEASNARGITDSPYEMFDWKSLPLKGTLIDLGGGIGAASYALAGFLPEWKIIVQDRPEVVKLGNMHYQSIGSTARMEFEEHDFFRPQPVHRVQAADAYFLRHILHDWPESECLKILTLLRQAAKPSTYLLICETKLEPTVSEKGSILFANDGMATSVSHNLDLTMMLLFKSKERSTKEYAELFEKSGWKLDSAIPLINMADKYIFKGVPDSDWKPHCLTQH
ncbi:hypothetical protein O181_063271 [Austropuccinia psidii MF-1]|uniref:O-methyltransferase C-terminal domain-containing protein n=1 Tax=Austropuccinia psidii MF-1 TaxID=1389203 RepID=A0A9Q3HZ96_9BASI|nr:hypothetical protein [Austropuccinia psidii MF-1]